MGYDFYGVAIIGVSFGEDDIPSVEKDSCAHEDRIGKKFCPICGTRVETILVNNGAVIDALEGFGEHHVSGLLFIRNGFDGENLLFGYGVECGMDDSTMIKVPDLKKIKKMIRAILDPFGLYDEQKFGLYAVTYGG